jgi:hypothetical protein
VQRDADNVAVFTEFKSFLKRPAKAFCCYNKEQVSDRINCIIVYALLNDTLSSSDSRASRSDEN